MQPVVPTVQRLSLVTRTGLHPTALYFPDSGNIKRPSFSTVQDLFARKSVQTSSGDFDVPDSKVPILDQRALGSCVLNALCAATEIALTIEGHSYTALSRLWMYWLCSQAQGTIGQDTGTEVSLAIDRATAIGFCEEAFWPYTDDAAKFFVLPADAIVAMLEGSDNKLTASFKIDGANGKTKADQCEMAIRALHTPQIGSPVDNTIQTYQPGQVLTVPNQNAIIGGHSWLLTGVRFKNGQRQFKSRNSWGAGYGENGYFWIDEAWIEYPDFNDINVVTRMDPLLF